MTEVWGLDDLTRKEAADVNLVLSQLRLQGKFTNFEVTANQTIAGTVQRLIDSGRVKIERGVFPITYVVEIDGETVQRDET